MKAKILTVLLIINTALFSGCSTTTLHKENNVDNKYKLEYVGQFDNYDREVYMVDSSTDLVDIIDGKRVYMRLEEEEKENKISVGYYEFDKKANEYILYKNIIEDDSRKFLKANSLTYSKLQNKIIICAIVEEDKENKYIIVYDLNKNTSEWLCITEYNNKIRPAEGKLNLFNDKIVIYTADKYIVIYDIDNYILKVLDICDFEPLYNNFNEVLICYTNFHENMLDLYVEPLKENQRFEFFTINIETNELAERKSNVYYYANANESIPCTEDLDITSSYQYGNNM
jgi:hypothetical protein